MLKAVLFDIDGVLLHSEEALYHCFFDCIREFGYSTGLTREELLSHNYGLASQWLSAVVPNAKNVREMVRWIADNYTRYLVKYARINQDALSVLNELKKQGLKTAIVTNQTREEAQASLSLLNFPFDAVVNVRDVKHPKPSPEPVLLALKKLGGLQANEVLFVGDTPADYSAGKDAGVRVVLLYNEFNPQVANAQKIFSLKEVLNLV